MLQGLGCTRLELEETAWRFRRERLLEQEEAARGAGEPRFVEAAKQFSQRLRERQEAEGDDPLRREVRALLSSIAVLVEEILVRVLAEARGRAAAAATSEGAADPEEQVASAR